MALCGLWSGEAEDAIDMMLPSEKVFNATGPTMVWAMLRLMQAGTNPVNLPARLLLREMVKALMRLLVAARKQNREDIWRSAEALMEDFARKRTELWAREMNIDPDNLDDMVRMQDREDYVFGVTGHWETRSRDKATRVETACPFAEVAKGDAEICARLIHRFEVATFLPLNPAYRLADLHGLPLLSRGDNCCRFEHSLELARTTS